MEDGWDREGEGEAGKKAEVKEANGVIIIGRWAVRKRQTLTLRESEVQRAWRTTWKKQSSACRLTHEAVSPASQKCAHSRVM